MSELWKTMNVRNIAGNVEEMKRLFESQTYDEKFRFR